MPTDLQTDVDLSLQVAAIAGWENIQEWNPNPKAEKPRKVFQGINKKHPELGIFLPDYASDLSAIWHVFDEILGLYPCILKCQGQGYIDNPMYDASCLLHARKGKTPAIALCNLLLAMAQPSSSDDSECDLN